MNRYVAVVRSCLLAVVCVGALYAQRDLSTIVGTVTDPSGAAVASAKIIITEQNTGLAYAVETSATGDYIRPALPPGPYTVQVEAPGFRMSVQKDIVLTAGDRTGINITLTVGDVGQSIEVTAGAPLLQAESTVIGTDLNSKQVSELPLGGQRTFSYLARLSPGVVPPEPGARDASGGGFSANGVRSNGQNNFLLNGVDNNVNVIDFLNQTSFVVNPSVDAIGEIRVLTNGYNAEYGRGAGGVVNVTIKSGTNGFHGTVFEYLQNTDLNANSWENNKNGDPRQPYHQNQFGATIGGPIIKNRTFFFADYQGTRIAAPSPNTVTFTVPTVAERSGDFSALLGPQIGTDPYTNAPIYQNQIYDPTSQTCVAACSNPDPSQRTYDRTPFAGNKIPASRIDPVSAKIAALFPNPTSSNAAGLRTNNNYFNPTNSTNGTDQGDLRIDHRISDKDSIFGSLSWGNTAKLNAQPLPGALDGTYFSSNAEQDLARNGNISYTRVWSPSFISETRVAFTRLVTARTQADPNTDQFKAFGIGGYDPTSSLNGGLPSFGIDNYSGFGASDWLPSKEYNNVWDFIQNVSINKGNHAYKFGFEFRPIQFPFFQVPSPHGDLNFSRNDTAFPNNSNNLATNTGDGFASFLLGVVNNGQISSNNFISSTKQAYAGFAQDDWKITPKLTLNLGLRYELFSPIGEKFGRQSSFDFATQTLFIPSGPDSNSPLPPNFATQFPQVTVSRGKVSQYLIPWDKTDFSPRIGAAYQFNSKTVFRLGYGIFYGGEENQGGYPNRGEAVPFNETAVLNRNIPGTSYSLGNFGENTQYFPSGLQGGFPSNVFSLPVPVSFRAIATDFRNPLVHKWNVALQRDLGRNSALELSYVGNHQAHQVYNPDPNAPASNGDPNANYDASRPFPNVGGIAYTASNGFGNYAGMTAKLEKRYSGGLNALVSYTYGHATSDVGTTLTGSSNFGTPNPQNQALAYSSAAWDIRHSVVASFTWDIPFGKGRTFGNNLNPVVSTLIGNWQFNGIATFHTGPPYGIGSNGCLGIWGVCHADIIDGAKADTAPSNGRTANEWFDTSVFRYPAILANGYGTPGNLGNNTNNAPPTRTVDVSVFKDFAFTERFRFQFRAECFNLGNTPQYSQPDSYLPDSTFGQVLGTQGSSSRRFQMSARILF